MMKLAKSKVYRKFKSIKIKSLQKTLNGGSNWHPATNIRADSDQVYSENAKDNQSQEFEKIPNYGPCM